MNLLLLLFLYTDSILSIILDDSMRLDNLIELEVPESMNPFNTNNFCLQYTIVTSISYWK